MHNDGGLTRREILELGMLTGLSSGLAAATPVAAAPGRRAKRRQSGDRPRNIIFMVSDGMSMGVPSLADPFSQHARGEGTQWWSLMRDPSVAQGFFDMRSLNTLVTDSAAASTSWGSGSRVFNGAINVLPDGTRMTPIVPLVRDAGRRAGLVTTTRVTHATPAGFATVQAKRGDEDEIAPQFMSQVDVLMGGGRKFFDARLRSDKRDVIREFGEAGFAFWDERSQVRGRQRPEKVLGLFWDDHVPYTVDHRNRPDISDKVPTLAEMTKAALDILGDTDDGFLLQVEGGRVDHAAHANDAAGLLWDQLAFDDAIAVVREFVYKHPDTLVVITSDHGNANPGLNGMGGKYRDSTTCLHRVAKATASFEGLHPRLAAVDSVEDVHQVLRDATGLAISTEEAAIVRDALAGKLPDELNAQHRNMVGTLGQILGNHNGVGWTGITHTADLVPISAFGPGAERFGGLLANTDAFVHLTELWGIRHRNPRLTEEQARPYASAMAEEPVAHWM